MRMVAIQLGQTVGDYEVIDLIESSKKNVIYKVRNVLVQRFEALRVLPKALQDDQEKATRFLREAKVHARINHPNIETFYHATILDGQLVMTTELVEGPTLAHRLELGPIPVKEALGYVSQILSALAHAHASGVVHRDITTSNIILTPDGTVKLGGFSMAKFTADPQLTEPGTVIGSLDYISPEQIKGLAEIDGRADIYSLGVVLYEAVTGRKPFEQKSQFEVMLAHVNTLPVAPSIVNPELPAELSEIIMTAMAKSPSFRFQTAEDFQRRVDRLRGAPPAARESGMPAAPSAEAPAVKAAPPVYVPGRQPASWWSEKLLVAAGLFTFIITILIFFVIARRF